MVNGVLVVMFGFSIGCVNLKESTEEDDGQELAFTDSSPQRALRRSSYFSETISEAGETEIRSGDYLYHADGHWFWQVYEGTRATEDTTFEVIHTRDMDADGFPMLQVSSVDGEVTDAAQMVWDKERFLLVELHSYDDESASIPNASRFYAYDEQRRLKEFRLVTYHPDSTQPSQVEISTYIGQQALLPGTAGYRLSSSESYTETGESTGGYGYDFGDNGLPFAGYTFDDSGTRTSEFAIAAETDDRGRPIRLTHGPQGFGGISEAEFGYDERGLLSHVLHTLTTSGEADSEVPVANPDPVTERIDVTWHRNPIGGISGGRYTTYSTIDGEPSSAWNELTWTEDVHTTHGFSVDGEPTSVVEIEREIVDLPDL